MDLLAEYEQYWINLEELTGVPEKIWTGVEQQAPKYTVLGNDFSQKEIENCLRQIENIHPKRVE